MDFEKLSDRLKGFVQAAQTLAVRDGNPADHARASLEGAARRSGGAGEQSDRARRRRSQAGARSATDAALAKLPKCRAAARPSRISRRSWRACSTRPSRWRTRPATVSSRSSALLLALAMTKDGEPQRILADAGVTPQALNAAINELRKGRTADTASAEEGYDALKKYARDLTEAAREGQARSGDRPRRGNPPHHPGAVAPHQEQSGADRRAGRRQDRHRRGPGATASSTATCRRA